MLCNCFQHFAKFREKAYVTECFSKATIKSCVLRLLYKRTLLSIFSFYFHKYSFFPGLENSPETGSYFTSEETFRNGQTGKWFAHDIWSSRYTILIKRRLYANTSDKKCSYKVAQLHAFRKFDSESSFQMKSKANLLNMSIKNVTQIIFSKFTAD